MSEATLQPVPANTTGIDRVRITQVEVIPVRIPFSAPFKIASGAARLTNDTLYVRLHTDAGITGLGETQAWRRQGSVETLASLIAAIETILAPHLTGRSPFAMNAIMADLDEALYNSFYAKAAIGDALMDLQGKLLGVPVHVLLGGRCRDWLEACAVLSIKPDFAETMDQARAFWDRGFTSFTFKVGLDTDADIRNTRTLREAFPDAILRIDANAAMGFDAAATLLERIAPYGIDAAEQLIALWDVEGMAELARRTTIPLMADECLGSDHDLMRIIQLRAARVLQTKVAKNGGIHRSRHLWALAHTAGMRIYPGNHPSTSVATASVVQLAAAWPGALLHGPFAVGITGALAADPVEQPLTMQGNRVLVPKGPGLGVTLDDDRIAALRVDL
ncbi:mandelate racemase/muconate lactonizing enzyme family protein [Szabonella alba]|uniref:Mandelate racemase/muconate lactonizing enzyme C-terminal domain-containing protein n=1 Tax=Szabonella alba TaxID=2804194 RepID=A0A8K0Y299_9RHOB|nr:enolase C-terminal domain-like protein [Szabonella alba]MBL4919233.1 hypothetical protein [Szabonella alba]